MIRPYGPADRAAVIALFRGFMHELTPSRLQREFSEYVEKAIREELGKIDDYYLGRDNQGFWIADEDGVIGMVGIERHASDAAELRRMAVDLAPPPRRRACAARHRGGLLQAAWISPDDPEHLGTADARATAL